MAFSSCTRTIFFSIFVTSLSVEWTPGRTPNNIDRGSVGKIQGLTKARFPTQTRVSGNSTSSFLTYIRINLILLNFFSIFFSLFKGQDYKHHLKQRTPNNKGISKNICFKKKVDKNKFGTMKVCYASCHGLKFVIVNL